MKSSPPLPPPSAISRGVLTESERSLRIDIQYAHCIQYSEFGILNSEFDSSLGRALSVNVSMLAAVDIVFWRILYPCHAYPQSPSIQAILAFSIPYMLYPISCIQWPRVSLFSRILLWLQNQSKTYTML